MRWRVAEILKERKMTPYKLAQLAGVTFPVVYRIVEPGAAVQRIEGRTLDALCKALDVQPGELLEYVPEPTKKKGRGKR